MRGRIRTYTPEWYHHITPDQVDMVRAMAERVQAAFAPLCAIAARESDVPLAKALEATILTLEALCADEQGNHRALYDGETGTMLRGVLTQILASDTDLTFEPSQWPSILGAITSTMQVKPKTGGHPRVSILGALEARLQSVDMLVLGGLNEGTWPRQTTNDAFLTRGMKAQMAMQPPERRIGLSAHDFQMGMGQPKVLLTRAIRVDDAPAVASRWVQRLETLAGAEAVKNMRSKGTRFVDIARALEKPENADFVERPKPQPPLEARPTHFSVTEIERLRRDPYAIYAKKILGLYPLEPFVRDPDAATRGTLIHKILELATIADIDYASEHAPTLLAQIASDVFDKEQLPEEIALLWRARFDAAIPKIIEWELDRQNMGVKRFAELKSDKIAIDGTHVTLSGRADRLDCNTDGTVDIIDFKTGSPPTGKQVRALLSPQLPLEAALLRRGGFQEIKEKDVGQLLYVQLGNAGKFEPKDVAKGKKEEVIDTKDLAERAWAKLIDLMKYYGNKNRLFIAGDAEVRARIWRRVRSSGACDGMVIGR
ncbi:MAG: double-strand break repair protein AddB [Ahrensia sp.]|nr:double-strand break repair protein AddB [Ahrensia sp.]